MLGFATYQPLDQLHRMGDIQTYSYTIKGYRYILSILLYSVSISGRIDRWIIPIRRLTIIGLN
jgi:hypothetical protein